MSAPRRAAERRASRRAADRRASRRAAERRASHRAADRRASSRRAEQRRESARRDGAADPVRAPAPAFATAVAATTGDSGPEAARIAAALALLGAALAGLALVDRVRRDAGMA